MSQEELKESFTAVTRKLFSNPFYIILLTTSIIRNAIYNAIEPFSYLFLRDIGVSYIRIGLLDLVYSFVIIIAVLIGAYFSDLLPYRRSKFAAAHNCCWGIMCIFYFLATGFWSALVVFVIAGFSWAFFPAARTYLLEQSGEKYRHFAMGFFSIYRLPLLLMFLLLLRLIRVRGFVLGMRIAFFFAGFIIVLMGLIRWKFLTDPPKHLDTPKYNPSLTGMVKDNVKTLRFVWKVAPAFCLITSFDAMSDQLYRFLIFFFLNEKAGLSEGDLLTGRLTLDFLTVPLILWLSFRINRSRGRRPFFLLYLVPTSTVGLLLVSRSHPIIPFIPEYFPIAFTKLAFLAYSIKYVSDFLWMLILAPLAMSFVSRENATKAIGISWLLVYFFRLIGAPIAGWLYQSDHIPFLLFSILALNCVILLAIVSFNDFNKKGINNSKGRPLAAEDSGGYSFE
ncbi:MAG: MFS transporter [Candidatus Heimdallarchaeota archaeon]